MATVFMSPGIYVNEIDRSQYVQILTSTILAIVTPASKGAVNQATFCSTYADMVSKFGLPSAAYPGLQVARDFFAAGGNQCWIVRVAVNDLTASCSLPLCDGSSLSIPGATSGSDLNNLSMNVSYSNQAPKSYSTSMNLVLFNQETATIGGTLTVGDQLKITFTNAGITGSPVTVSYTTVGGDTTSTMATGLKNAINANPALKAANISATVASNVVTISAPTSLGSVTYGQTVTGSATETIVLASGSTNQSAPQTYNITLLNTATSGETATLSGTITVGDVLNLTFTNSNITGSPVTVSYTTLTGDTLTTAAAGLAALINANVNLSTAGITATASGAVVTINALQSLGSVTYGQSVSGAQTETITLGVVAGTVGNNPVVPGTISIPVNGAGGTITDDSKGNLVFTPASCGIAGTTWSGTVNYNTGVMTVTVTGATVASSPALVPSFNYFQNFIVQLWYTMLNSTTGAVINKFTPLQYVQLNTANFQASVSNSAYVGQISGTSLSSFPKAGYYQFSGGTDGTVGLTDAQYVGVGGSNPTGLQIFANPDTIDINTICVPGKGGSIAVRSALVQLVTQSRSDCIALMAGSQNENTPQAIVQWANGQGAYNNFGVLNNTFCAVYYPWYMTYNSSNGSFENTPPEAAAAAAFARSDYFEAPAGVNRGMVNNVTSIPPLSQGDRDFLYYNRINPISNLLNMGVMVAGQKTATLIPSSLDRVGARKVLCRLEKAVVKSLTPLLEELDNALTWQRAMDIVQPTLDGMVAKGILRYGKIICDGTTNTSDTIAQNQMVCNIVLLLPKYAEFIVLNFLISENSSSINENLVSQNPFN